ncbi:MAG: oxygen-independent coproporphyrinogen III oxidase [Pseudomonadota bacterium]
MTNVQDILAHYGGVAPRYTSYPTAPHFQAGLGKEVLAANLEQMERHTPISLYIHIPFCDRLCWFCGCHTKHTNRYKPVAEYVQSLIAEIALLKARMAFAPTLGALHFGGGSPSLLNGDDLAAIKSALEQAFVFNDDTEISFEIDPSDALERTFEDLAAFGITRVSLGVQDFNPDVQKAINRFQSFEQTLAVVEEFRRLGVTSLNIDALYGLPHQSEERLQATLEQCLQLQPDRIALFGYAHVPWLKSHQKMISNDSLPDMHARFQQARRAAHAIETSGYEAIGLDHFAKPDDALAVASRTGQLRRNFQGYTTDAHDTLLGLGASSIGKGVVGYVQNTVPTNMYRSQVEQGILPVDKGLILTDEDRYRAAIIEALMCNFEIDFTAIPAPALLVEDAVEVATDLCTTDPFGLVYWDDAKLCVTPKGRPFVRSIASRFDQYLAPSAQNQPRFSMAV